MRKRSKKLVLSRETLVTLADSKILRVAGAATAGDECSGNYTSCASQWPNCEFTGTCPTPTADWCSGQCTGKCV